MSNLTKNTNDLQEVLKILANKVDSSTLQPKHDEALNTESKEIVDAINELRNEIYCPERVTDLANTTWEIQAGWQVAAGYGRYECYGEIINQGDQGPGQISLDCLYLGYSSKLNAVANTLSTTSMGITSSDPFTISFTDGSDLTNTDLINWLYKYGTIASGAPTNLVNRVDQAENAINEINGKTVDKVKSIDMRYLGASDIDTSEGISWIDGFAFYDDVRLDGNQIQTGDIHQRVPIVAGKNVELEVDEKNQVVKINHAPYSQGLEYRLSADETNYSVNSVGTCTDTDIIIPKIYEGLPVTGITDGAFAEKTINSIFVPKSITGIYDPFYGCKGLTTIYCEAKTQPDNWYPNWSSYGANVVWGFANDFVAVNDKLGDISAVLDALITKSQNILEGGTE